MIYQFDSITLRKPDRKDMEALYQQKNDPELAGFLVGFARGYSREDIVKWIDERRQQENELLWIIADSESDECLGHVGLYNIDYRIRSAEFGILVGRKERWGQGIGRQLSRFALDYAFSMLNLNRVVLHVLEHNQRARKLYKILGFEEEGVLRQAQYKQGRYLDVVVMGILRDEYRREGVGLANSTSRSSER